MNRPKLDSEINYIYVISAIQNDVPVAPCKIGLTRHPTGRLSGIQTGNPCRLELVSVVPIPGRLLAKWVEAALHDHFEEFRLEGEWFDLCPVDAAIGVCALAREMFLAICKDAPETAERAVDDLGIAAEIKNCFDFIASCQRRGLPLATRFGTASHSEQTVIH